MLKAVVFDGYGTLFFTGTGSVDAAEEILALNGRRDLSPKAFYGEWKLLHHRHMEELPDFRLEKELYALDLEELYQKYRFTRDPRRDVEVMLAIQGTRAAFPEVKQVLEELASRFLLAVGSTTDTAPLLQDLDRAGLPIPRSRIFTSQSLKVYKPHPAFYRAILETLEVAPEETLFVGDSLKDDVKGPQNVGMRTCWVNRKGEERGDIFPDLEIPSLQELPEALGHFPK